MFLFTNWRPVEAKKFPKHKKRDIQTLTFQHKQSGGNWNGCSEFRGRRSSSSTEIVDIFDRPPEEVQFLDWQYFPLSSDELKRGDETPAEEVAEEEEAAEEWWAKSGIVRKMSLFDIYQLFRVLRLFSPSDQREIAILLKAFIHVVIGLKADCGARHNR